MKDNRKTEVRVGITVLAAIIIFIFILGWAKNFSLSSDEQILSVKFNNVAGLGTGDAVMVNGVRKGYVEEIFSEGNSVTVKVLMEKDTDLREDASFSIMMLDLMGGKKIEINPGVSTNKIDYSIVHNGEFLGDIATTMAMLSSVQYDLVDVIKEIKISLTQMNSLITDDAFMGDLKKSVANLNSLTENFDGLLRNNKDNITRLVNTSNELAETTNDLLKNNKSAIDSTIQGIRQLLNTSNTLLSKLDSIASGIENRDNNLGKILYDENLLENITTSLKQVKDLTRILIDQLEGEGLNVKADIDLF